MKIKENLSWKLPGTIHC